MTTPVPTASHWTLRLKHDRTTILLLAVPSAPFDTIKSDLITALLSSGKTSLGGHDLTSTKPEDIELAMPRDQRDLTTGWVALKIGEEEEEDDVEEDIKNTKKKSKSQGKALVANSSPLAAGLKEGSALAFRWKGQDVEWDVTLPSYEDEADDDDEMKAD